MASNLKELEELECFIVDLACLIISQIKEHNGKPLEIITEILVGLVSDKMRDEGMAAFEGLKNLPDELKSAGIFDWTGFLVMLIKNAIPQIMHAINA